MSYKIVITDKEDGVPIILASSIEKAEELLFEYMGLGSPTVGDDESVVFLGFKKMEYSEFEDSYDGYYSFKTKYGFDTDYTIQNFGRFTMYLDQLI
jgi:hypothetical protein